MNTQLLLNNDPFEGEKLQVLEQLIQAFYSGDPQQMIQANQIITQLEDSNFWLKTDGVIKNCQNEKTLFFAYSSLQKGIKQKWTLLQDEQKQALRFFVETLLTDQLQQQNINQNLLRKVNSIMVEIIKKELNNSWPTALTDLAQASYKSQIYCQNILQIFKELSVEVFDFWENSLTQSEFQNLKEKLQESFKAIYDVFIFVLQSYLNNNQQISYQLVYTCLETLEVYCSWIPIGYIIMDPLPQYLAEMVSQRKFQHITLKCIEQIFSVDIQKLDSLSSEELNKCQQDFFNFYIDFLQKFQTTYNSKTNFQLVRNQIISNSDNTVELNQFDILCQNLSLTLNAFFQTHLDWIVQKYHVNSNNAAVIFNLAIGIEYMAQLTVSGDQSTLKTCVEFFLFFTEYFKKIYEGLMNQTGFQQNQHQGLVNMMKKLVQEGPINTAIYNLTLKMPQPQEIQIEIDDDGIPHKTTFVNTSQSSFYNTMKKMFRNFAVLNWKNFSSILNNRLSKQVDNSEFNYEYLNSLCWTIGCLAHQIKGEDEKTFFVLTLRTLLAYIKSKTQMNDKCVIATNIMHIVSQYNNFLKENKEFNRIVIGKLFEFMREKIPGVPEMSCSVFVKLCKGAPQSFKKDEKIDDKNTVENNFNFVFNNYKQQVMALNDQLLIQEFYDALGVIVSVQNDESLKNEIINEIMTEYTKVVVEVQQNLNNTQFLLDLTTTQHLNFALKINHLISQHTKESYYNYFNNAFPNIIQIYEAYLGIINQALQTEGPSCLNQVSIKAYRKIRTNILILIENLVKTVNAQNQPEFLRIYQKLIYFSLELYTKEDPLIREPQILSFIGVCLEKFRGQMFDTFATMVPSILQSILPLITKDFHSYPEHRQNFFKLIQTLVKHCFQIFNHIDQQSFMLIMNCIIWAIKHELPSTYELGLRTLNSLLREINQNQNMIDFFYQKFYASIINDLFYIWTDGLHQNGTHLIAESLFLMLNILNQIKVNLFENQNCDNYQAVYEQIFTTLSGNQTNLSKKDHEKNLKAVLEASTKSSKILEQTLNDYAVSLKIYTRDQLITTQQHLILITQDLNFIINKMNQETALLITIWSAIILALLWSLICTLSIKKIKISSEDGYYNMDPYSEKNSLHNNTKLEVVEQIGQKIAKGANTFLIAEYKVMTIFIVLFSVVIFFLVDFMGTGHLVFYSTVAFIVGSFTSIICGYIGMSIAVTANYRTTFKATSSLPEAFQVSYQAGCVMGFSSIGLGLGILLSLMLIYQALFQPKAISINDEFRTYATLMELLASYGLGGSSMALFGRVGGGIYTKAADVGADLVGKVEEGLDEDSPRNPATIADNVGDNVGDIAGMGSDLFGSFAESTCATLVIISNTSDLIKNPIVLYFPLLILSVGIFACFLTSIFGIYINKVKSLPQIQRALNTQLLISTLLTLAGMYFTIYILPSQWNQTNMKSTINRINAFICPAMGLISGFFIGISTDYFTSHAYKPVREMARACSSGAAINIIYGLALGYLSTIVPVILIAVTIITCIKILGLLGVALAAIGMLSTLPIGLAIDAYGPICDNAGGIAEMAELGEEVREITDALDAAGNTTAAVGKGFAIGSAALVSLALYGAFLTRARQGDKNVIKNIDVINPWIFGMFFIGAMLPYAFSALTMKSVGIAAVDMVQEVRRQFQDPAIKNGTKEPDYSRCIQVSTNASLREMILPGLLVMITPIFFGVVFHPVLVAGLLPGALLSGVQLAISMSNTGGAWDNTKKFIESGSYCDEHGVVKSKGSFEHKAAVTGDTVGDPLKDTSGPSLNILIKLMAIISLVFISAFQKTSLLAGILGVESD